MGEMIRTPLHRFLSERGAKFVDFAGYELPMQFSGKGFIKEHLHCRGKASLFDVSHMGQFKMKDHERELSGVFPVNPLALPAGSGRYTQLLRKDGGTIDDLIVSNDGDFFFVVFNASRKDAAVQAVLDVGTDVEIETVENALLALQGPAAEAILSDVFPDAARLGFMQSAWMKFEGDECRVSRSGYTGEDGFEISVPPMRAEELCGLFAKHPDFDVAGLGARDSLRLEAGLCLYGNELDEETTPVEAGLTWSIPKARRNPGEFVGSERVVEQINSGPSKTLVGLKVTGKIPVRGGAALRDKNGEDAGKVVSGVFSPTLGVPIATAYVRPKDSAAGTPLEAIVRDKSVECTVSALPFVTRNYKK